MTHRLVSFLSPARVAHFSSSRSNFQSEFVIRRKRRWGFLALLGCATIYGLHTETVYMQEDPEKKDYIGKVIVQPELLTFLPTRLISRFAGYLANSHPPNSFKALFLGNYSKLYGCNLQEIDLNATFENSGKQFPDVADLHDTREIFDLFPTVQSFFSRRIKQREVDQSALVSPVDGTVLSFGEVNGDDTVEQVKGIRYSIPALVGERFQPTSPDNKINHVIIYLAPGDYHGIHAPADFHVQRRKHFPGELLPVAPLVARSVPSLFAINERVALNGSWSHGFFSLISVGATNVGSITVKFDPEMKTNNAKDRLLPLTPFERDFGANAVACIKGEEVAFFHLGSTVILVFESPKDFSFTLKPGQKLKYGQNIGDIASFPLA